VSLRDDFSPLLEVRGDLHMQGHKALLGRAHATTLQQPCNKCQQPVSGLPKYRDFAYGAIALTTKGLDLARAKRIKKAMEARNLRSASALATEAGVNRSTAGRWMKGENLTDPNVSALAAALRTTRAYILAGDANEPPPGEVEMLEEEIAQSRADFLTGLNALAKESADQRKALEGLLSRVERLEQNQAGSSS